VYWVPLVKIIKDWNRANGNRIKPSFLVEVVAEELGEAPFSTYSKVRNFFAAMEANIGRATGRTLQASPLMSWIR
jgi:hypothetical protein